MPDRCPTCDSHSPELHPAVQFEGEVAICPDPFHDNARVPVGCWRHPDGTVRRIPDTARELTDNEVLALHIRRDHSVTGGWVSDPVPPGSDWAKLLNQIHLTACKTSACAWTGARP